MVNNSKSPALFHCGLLSWHPTFPDEYGWRCHDRQWHIQHGLRTPDDMQLCAGMICLTVSPSKILWWRNKIVKLCELSFVLSDTNIEIPSFIVICIKNMFIVSLTHGPFNMSLPNMGLQTFFALVTKPTIPCRLVSKRFIHGSWNCHYQRIWTRSWHLGRRYLIM